MGIDDELVHDAESTVRRSETVGERCLYLTYKLGPEARDMARITGTFVVPLRLPRLATNVELHGPGNYKTEHGVVYAVQIMFTEVGRNYQHKKTVKLPHPAVNVQLLDREPNEAYRKVA